jgi:hypothetical protein
LNNGPDNFMAWQRLNTAPWLAGKVIRVAAQISCPTTTDRANFHTTRIRHGITSNNIIQTMFINQSNLGAFGNPGMPPARNDAGYTGPMTYETYVPSFGGPTPYMLSNFPQFASWALSLDEVHGRGTANANLATQVTSPTSQRRRGVPCKRLIRDSAGLAALALANQMACEPSGDGSRSSQGHTANSPV